MRQSQNNFLHENFRIQIKFIKEMIIFLMQIFEKKVIY